MKNHVLIVLGRLLLPVLVLLMASCSQDFTEDQSAVIPPADDNKGIPLDNMEGEYEGEWLLSLYGSIATGKLKVSQDKLVFDLPAEALLPKLGLVSEETIAAFGDEPFFAPDASYNYFDLGQSVEISLQGYSDNAYYSSISSVTNQIQPVAGHPAGATFAFGVTAGTTDYWVDLAGRNETGYVMYDYSTGLWSLAIPIEDINVVNVGTARTIHIAAARAENDDPAWRLVFRAARKN